MAIQLGSAYGKVNIDASGVKSGVGSAVKDLDSLSQIAKKVGGDMQKMGAAMTIGLTLPIVAFFKSSVTSATEAESALAEVNAVLKSTGGIAGVTSDEIQKMAAELQKVTKFSDEEIMSGQSMLLTFTKIGKDVFPQATEAVLNMAEKFGSVQNASIQLGKALNDPVAGVGALRRVGVMLSDEQENQIKQFMKVNDIASAQKIILQELETEFGGLARAAGDTTAGKFAQLKNAFDDLKEVAGQAIIPLLLKLAEAATKMINAFMAMPSWMQKTILVLLALVAMAGPVLAFMGTVISMIGSIMSAISFLSQAGVSFAAVSAAASTAGSTLLAFGSAALSALGSILLLLAGPALLYWAFKTNFMGIADTAKQLWFIIKFYFAEGWKWLLNAVKGGGTIVADWFRRMTDKIVQAFRNIKWPEVGKNIIFGLINGLLFGIPSLVIAATKVAGSLLDAIKRKLGVHSPSTEAIDIGKNVGLGFSQGMTTSMANLDKNSPYQRLLDVMNANTKIALDLSKNFVKDYYDNISAMEKGYADTQVSRMASYFDSVKAYYENVKQYAALTASWKPDWSKIKSSGSTIAPYMEQINGKIPVEKIKNTVPVEQSKPVKVEVIQNFSSGVTVRQASDMIKASQNDVFKSLNHALGGF